MMLKTRHFFIYLLQKFKRILWCMEVDDLNIKLYKRI